MGNILIEGLELWTKIGVPEEERAQKQRVIATIEITTDTHAAAESDDLTKSIDYEKVTKDIRALAKEERRTLERFAEDIAGHILGMFHPTSVKISLTKFPIPGVQNVSVTITRP